MGHSGLVNFQRLENTLPWVKVDGEHHTFVYAFWLVDYGRLRGVDAGVDVLKQRGRHPDWFIHAETADRVMAAYLNPQTWVSPNWVHVFDEGAARPLLAAMLVGTSDARYQVNPDGRLWWCDFGDLTVKGRALLKRLNALYERRAILVTFLDRPTDGNSGLRDPS